MAAGFGLYPVRQFVNDLPKSIDARRGIRRWFNLQGLMAERDAKAAAPVLTGALRSSINWRMIGTSLSKHGRLQGRLQVGVVYGRRQEWEHRSRSFYMWYAILAASRRIEQTLGNETGAASVWLSAGGGVRGYSFNPGLSSGPTGGAAARSFEEGVAGGGVHGSGRVGAGGI